MLGLILTLVLSKLIVDQNPEYAVAQYTKGMTHALAGEYSQAEQYFTEALRLEPRSESLWKYRSIARGMLGNMAGASSDWEESQKWNPVTIQKTVEDAYDAQDWSTILRYTEWSANRKRLAPAGHFYHGRALIARGRIDEGFSFIKRALEHEEELVGLRAEAHFLYALLVQSEHVKSVTLSWFERYQEAVDHFDKAWDAGYQTASLLKLRANNHWRLKRKEAAFRDLRKAILLDSKSIELRIELIRYLNESENWQDAHVELVWLKRLTMTSSETLKYGDTIKKLDAVLANQSTKEKTDASFSPKSLEKEWDSRWPR